MKAKMISLALMATLFPLVANAAEDKAPNSYKQTNLVANKEIYNAEAVDEKLINAWGIAIRPAGKGGHFWVAGKDQSFEYVGDVQNSADESLRKLHKDKLEYVKIPVGGEDNVTTGVVFSDSKDSFVITQKVEGVADVTAPAKFLFASDGGFISAWTERKLADGTFDRAGEANKVIDNSAAGAQYFGIALNKEYNRLYAANFGLVPGVEVFDGKFKPLKKVKFDMPFDDNKNGRVDPGEYAPFNVQLLKTPGGDLNVFVSYAKTQPCPEEEITKGSCKKGELFVGEEDTSKPGQGRIAEFTQKGRLVAPWKDGGKLSAPWGMVFAPKGFGALSGKLLVANFGDGTIAAYNPKTSQFVDYVRNDKGEVVKIDKIWGLIFGNGESLGDANALYFSAGPEDEKDGIFGSLRVVPAAADYAAKPYVPTVEAEKPAEAVPAVTPAAEATPAVVPATETPVAAPADATAPVNAPAEVAPTEVTPAEANTSATPAATETAPATAEPAVPVEEKK